MKPNTQLKSLIFVDGASSGNPGPGGWGAILVCHPGVVIELGGRDPHTTNNRMELTAAIQALSELDSKEVTIYTDSTYVIRGITQWIWGWIKKNWISSTGQGVLNSDLWKQLLKATQGKSIEWKYVKGHSGVPGNERADEIAVAYSKNRPPYLYRGSLLQYDIAIHDLPEASSLPEKRADKKKSIKSVKPYSYLSLVGGVLMRHESWPECEKRVKGRPGTKFKKAMNLEEENQILKTWGLSAEALKKREEKEGKEGK